MLSGRRLFLTYALVLHQSLYLVSAHSHGTAHEPSAMQMPPVGSPLDHHSTELGNVDSGSRLPSYFNHPEHAAMMYAHIIMMVVAWILVLPPAVMLSIGRSPLSFPVQFAFHVLNALGLVASVVYNARTPDLYKNNFHHRAGWPISFIVFAWTLLGIVKFYVDGRSSLIVQKLSPPVSQQAVADHHNMHGHNSHAANRWSHDSGQGTERNTDSMCSSPRQNSWQTEDFNMTKRYHDEEEDVTEHESFLGTEKSTSANSGKFYQLLSRTTSRMGRGVKVLRIIYITVERFLATLAFLILITGIVTYSGVFKGHSIFTGLAHLIKGGIFFWYGLLTFGRWMGCFSDFGWAWNIKPGAAVVGRWRARIPSAEFTESFVICLYGASNVFLEHLGGWGKAWSPMDLEHVSITIMFFGGGLLGMLIESSRVRDLMHSTLTCAKDRDDTSSSVWQVPNSYVHSMNPMPALVIMLLGIMMSSHHQHSAIAGSIHQQWGTMFVGFALARGVTYILCWIKPPSSYLPSRPPSEIVASFCLTGGGIIFMASNGNTVDAIESHGLDAMFVFTVVMGVTALIMAWAFGLVAIKGWAVERGRRRLLARTPFPTA